MNNQYSLESSFEDFLATKSSIQNRLMNDKSKNLLDKTLNELNSTTNNIMQPKLNLEEILKCFICFGRVKNAQMCPNCSKLCCNSCIKKWLTEQKSQCPHCRTNLKVSQLVNCRFINDLVSAIDSMNTKKEEDTTELCSIHQSKLYYYCKTCKVPICADCAMFGNDHKNHEFDHIAKVYEYHVDQVKTEALSLKQRMKELSSQLEQVESTIEQVTKNKEEKANELNMLMEAADQKLEAELKSKLLTLLQQKGNLVDEIEFLQNMQNELNRQLNQSPKSSLISKSTDLVKVLKEINAKPINKFNKASITLEFTSELIPNFDWGIYHLKPYSILKSSVEIVYSDPLNSNGLTWRLKIYPNGNGAAKGAYISVFLEMIRGLQDASKYEYKVEMINQKNNENLKREFASEFETGECWGYNRFYKIDLLEKEGYLLPEKDTIVFKYYIRAPTYYQQSLDQKRYIQYLENVKTQNDSLINELKSKIDVQTKKNNQLNERQDSHPCLRASHHLKDESEKLYKGEFGFMNLLTEKKTVKSELSSIRERESFQKDGDNTEENATTKTMEKIKNIEVDIVNKNDNIEETKACDPITNRNNANLNNNNNNNNNTNNNNNNNGYIKDFPYTDTEHNSSQARYYFQDNDNNNKLYDQANIFSIEEIDKKSNIFEQGEKPHISTIYDNCESEDNEKSLDELCEKISSKFVDSIKPIDLNTLLKPDETINDKNSDYSHVKNLLPNFEAEHQQMMSKKQIDQIISTTSVLQLSDSLLKKLEKIKNIHPQNRIQEKNNHKPNQNGNIIRNSNGNGNNSSNDINSSNTYEELIKKYDFLEKENRYQQLYNSMNVNINNIGDIQPGKKLDNYSLDIGEKSFNNFNLNSQL